MSYGKIIRNLRLSKSTYNRQNFAQLLDIPIEQLCDIEANKCTPSYEITKKLAELLKVHEGYLFQLIRENSSSSISPMREFSRRVGK